MGGAGLWGGAQGRGCVLRAGSGASRGRDAVVRGTGRCGWRLRLLLLWRDAVVRGAGRCGWRLWSLLLWLLVLLVLRLACFIGS